MKNDNEFFFEPWIGKPRDGGKRKLSFEQRIMRAIAKAGGDPRRIGGSARARQGRPPANGRFNTRGRGAKIVTTFPREQGWRFDSESGMRCRDRLVIVKARVIKLRGSESGAADAHLRYIQRDGMTREGEPGRLYAAWNDEADGKKFLARCRGDRHQFRLIVAPEDGPELDDLRPFTRRLMEQMERDLGTELDWVAVDHHNTGHPHSHIVIRGMTDDGKILNIAGDYIAHGIRHRAGEILTLDLGLQSEWEVNRQLGREVEQERFTRLDRALLHEADEMGQVDLRREIADTAEANRYLLLDRLGKLRRMGLAEEDEPSLWSLSPELEKTLRAMSERGDIIKTMHRALERQKLERRPDQYVLHRRDAPEKPIIGRVVGKGLAEDELDEKLHLVIDAADGKVHYLEIADPALIADARIGGIIEVGSATPQLRPADRNILLIARENEMLYRPSRHLERARATLRIPNDDYVGHVETHVRRLEALRRAGLVERLDADRWKIPPDFEQRALAYEAKHNRQQSMKILSTLDLAQQVTTDGATWLDREIAGHEPTPMQVTGFGAELRAALQARRTWLMEQGLMWREGNDWVWRGNLLQVLERRELQRAGRELYERHYVGKLLPFYVPDNGERVQGIYRRSLELASGKYALIENARGFTLVPWRPVIEKALGRQVSGQVRGHDISWELGRTRGRDIGM